MKTIFLRPKNMSEKVFLVVLLLSLFSGWPQLTIVGNATIEPVMLGWFIGALYFGSKSFTFIFSFLQRFPWISLLLWFMIGSFVSIVLTLNVGEITLRLLYLAIVLLFSISLYIAIKQKEVRVDFILSSWVLLAIGCSIFAIIQYILGSFTDLSVLAAPYRVGVFEFPRAHLFFQEPQYLANWLLAPALLLLIQKRMFLVTFLVFSALLLTLARGAFIGLLFVIPIVYILFIRRESLELQVKKIASLLLAAAFVCMLIGLSTIRNSDKSFIYGIGHYLDHATLGVFNKEGATNTTPVEVKTKNSTPNIDSEIAPQPQESFVTVTELDDQGVVEASTLGRLEAVRVARDIFNDSPHNLVLGVGLYRFGEEAQEKNPEIYSKDLITNNQYAQVLVETGLLGFALYFTAIFTSLVVVIKKQYSILTWAMIAVMIQFMFFSSYTILPFWLLFILLMSQATNKNRTFIWQKSDSH